MDCFSIISTVCGTQKNMPDIFENVVAASRASTTDVIEEEMQEATYVTSATV